MSKLTLILRDEPSGEQIFTREITVDSGDTKTYEVQIKNPQVTATVSELDA